MGANKLNFVKKGKGKKNLSYSPILFPFSFPLFPTKLYISHSATSTLIPENGKGLTTAEYPSFWFYIPYVPKDINSIEFSLHDWDETTTLYRTSLQLTKAPGAIGLPLPPSPERSLKLNESYHWGFIINCDRPGSSTSGYNISLLVLTSLWAVRIALTDTNFMFGKLAV